MEKKNASTSNHDRNCSGLNSAYVKDKIDPLLQVLLTEVLAQQPADPAIFMIKKLQEISGTTVLLGNGQKNSPEFGRNDPEKEKMKKEIEILRQRLKMIESGVQLKYKNTEETTLNTITLLHADDANYNVNMFYDDVSPLTDDDDDESEYGDLPDVTRGEYPKNWNSGQRQQPYSKKSSEDCASIREVLRSTLIFRDFCDDGINRLVAAFSKKKFPGGTRLLNIGDTLDRMLIINEGVIDVLQKSNSRPQKEPSVRNQNAGMLSLGRTTLRKDTSSPSFQLFIPNTHLALGEYSSQFSSPTPPILSFERKTKILETYANDTFRDTEGKEEVRLSITFPSPVSDLSPVSIYDSEGSPMSTPCYSSRVKDSSWLKKQLSFSLGRSRKRRQYSTSTCMIERVSAQRLKTCDKESSNHRYATNTSHDDDYDEDLAFVHTFGARDIIGELDLICDYKSALTYIARTDVSVWMIDRTACRQILISTTENKRKERMEFLAAIPLFRTLTLEEISKLVDVTRENNDLVVGQGALNESFFIVKSGWIAECKSYSEGQIPIEVRRLSSGAWFGENSIITRASQLSSEDSSIMASTFVAKDGDLKSQAVTTVLIISGKDVIRLIGSISELLKREQPSINKK